MISFVNTTLSGPVTPVCTRCKQIIPSDDINVAKDLAFCRKCDVSYSLSSLGTGMVLDENVDLSNPPEGAWCHRSGNRAVLGATHRSLAQAFGLLFMCLFWNGIVSFFVFMAAVSTVKNLGLPLPVWIRVPKGGLVPVGMNIFLWLFLTPFIVLGLGMVFGFLSSLAGRTEIGIQSNRAVLFTGIGPIGRRKRFSTSDIKDVRIADKSWSDSNGQTRRKAQIVIETNQKPITFGTMLTSDRQRFLASALKQIVITNR